MKKIKLKYLKLSNFKGFKQYEVSDFGDGVSIYGANATGKTTIFDSVLWLLFGKDSLNKADFDIKTLLPSGEPLHNLEHGVHAIFSTDNGDIIDLKKNYYEKYTKRRGEAHRTFTGHTSDHFVNGVPCKQKEFIAAVNEICTEDVFKLLTSPRYFNEVFSWTERRNLLFEMCGDVSDADVFASNLELSELPTLMGTNSLDDFKKIVKSKQTKTNGKLQSIPTRIDENRQSFVEVEPSKDELQADLKKQTKLQVEAESNLAKIKAGGGADVKEAELSKINTKINNRQNELDEIKFKRLSDQRQKIADLTNLALEAATATEKAVVDQANKTKEKATMLKESADLKKKRDALREQWFETDKQKFEPNSDQKTVCPACGQNLPEEQIAEASRLALEKYNTTKAADLTKIQNEGKAIASQIDEHNKKARKIANELAGMDEKIKNFSIIQEAAENKVDRTKAEHEKINTTQEPDATLADLQKKADNIQLEINALRAGTNETEMAAQHEIDEIKETIKAVNRDILQIETNEKLDKRLADLKKEEEDLSALYETLESHLYLIEQFIRTKADMLNEKISDKFKIAKFRLFTENINGGLEEACDTTLNGVPYSSLNNGARINVGLDICNTLSEYYGISLPCFIDNSESVTDLIQTDAQQIRLYVSKRDKELRIEKE